MRDWRDRNRKPNRWTEPMAWIIGTLMALMVVRIGAQVFG